MMISHHKPFSTIVFSNRLEISRWEWFHLEGMKEIKIDEIFVWFLKWENSLHSAFIAFVLEYFKKIFEIKLN